MQGKGNNITIGLFLLAAFAIVISWQALCAAGALSKKEKGKSTREPVLYLTKADSNDTEEFIADANWAGLARPNLVITTHGWYEKETWPKELAAAIKKKVDSEKWLCGWYDWRSQSKVINPADAAKYSRDVAGPSLGKKIVGLSKAWQHVHLIGHSAGAWTVSEAAKTIAKKTKANIHLTFLDAYVPFFWDENKLGDVNMPPTAQYWAEHYLTRDLTGVTTEVRLSGAHNVDLTDVNPGISDHKFGHYWYYATITGSFAEGGKYEGKKLVNSTDGIKYGFARSREAAEANWQESLKLKPGNKPVKIKKDKPLPLQLHKLLKPKTR